MIKYDPKTKQIVVSEFFGWDFINDRIEKVKQWARDQLEEFGPGDSDFTPNANKLIGWEPDEAEKTEIMKRIAEDMDYQAYTEESTFSPETSAENAVVCLMADSFGLEIDSCEVYE